MKNIFIIFILLLPSSVLAQKIYWLDTTANTIQRANLDGTNREVYFDVTTVGSSDPRGIAIDKVNNYMYWTDFMPEDIYYGKISNSTLTMAALVHSTSIGYPSGIDVDAADGKVYYANEYDGDVDRIDLDGSNEVMGHVDGDEFDEFGIAIDPLNDKIYWTEPSNGVIGSASLLLGNGETIIIGPGSAFIYNVAIDPINNKIYYTQVDAGVGSIRQANVDGTGDIEILGSLSDALYDIDLDVPNGKLYWSEAGTSPLIARANLDGSSREDIIIMALGDGPGSIALDLSIPAPPKMYWTENIGSGSNDEIHRTDLDGNDFERYYSGFTDEISGLVMDTANNRLYWTDAAQAEILYGDIGPDELISGPITILDYNPGSTNALVDLALDLANGHIYFTHGNGEGALSPFRIARVDKDGNNDIEIINTGFEEPFGIDIDLANGKIYYTTNFTSTEQEAKLYRANLDGTNVEELALLKTPNPTPEFIRDVKIDPVNQIVYWSYGPIDNAPGTIFFNDLNEAAPFSAPAKFNFPGEPRGIDLDLNNNKIYWVCRGANDGNTPPMIMRADLDGSNIENIFVVTIFPPGFPPGPPGSAFIALDLRGVGCINPPTANAGIDQTIIEGDVINLSGSIGGGATGLTWTTNGDGLFDNNTSATATYSPGTSDIASGSATLTLATNDPDGTGPCLATSDNILITIELAPQDIIVYNAVSPNGDLKHDYFEIKNIGLPNQVRIMNRWGDLVFEIDGYDNDTKKFIGIANKGGEGELPTGTYYYTINIVLSDGTSKTISGFITLRR